MKFAVRNYWSRDVQFTAEIECAESERYSVKLGLAVKWGFRNGANLTGADFTDANLSGADLAGANFTDACFALANLADAYLAGVNLTGADLRGANLARTNLAGADLTGADLMDANLVRANLTRANLGQDQKATIPPLFILGPTWPVMVTDAHIKIGCEVHTTDEWAGFSDKQICAMDGSDALRFWGRWKEPLLAMARAHQSKVAV